MHPTDYSRAFHAVFFSALLLSQHAVVDANAWVTGRSSRSSTLAVAAPGGRDRPIRDWKAMNRDAGKALEERRENAAEKAEEVVKAVEQVLPEVDSSEEVSDSLDLEQGTPQSLAIMMGKVAVIATVGVISAKKVVRFAKYFIKARKERSVGSVEDVSAIATTEGSRDEEELKDEAAAEVAAEEVAVVVDDDDIEEGDDEVTDVFATPDEEESDYHDSSERGEALSKAAEDVQARAESELENLTGSAGDDEGESDEGNGGDGSGVKYSRTEAGKGDVSYV